MRVGLLADTHDRVPAVAEFLKRFAEADVGLVLHAGDYCSPFSLKPFLEANMPLAGVFGRNDGDLEGLKGYASKGMGIELHDSPHSMEVEGQRILLVYELGEVNDRSIEASRFVVHGSTHQQDVSTRGNTVLVNPGEACGWLFATPMGAILDLQTGAVEIIRLTDPEWRA
jgi:uncharacterized protein